MTALIALVALTAPQDAFRGLDASPLVRPYQHYTGTWAKASVQNAKTLTDLVFMRDLKSSQPMLRLEIAAFQFADKSQVQEGVKSSRLGVQAATMQMPMPEFTKLGWETNYMGNPQLVEFNAFVNRVWVRVHLGRGDLVWQPRKGTDWAKAGAESLRKDKESMKLLLRLLPDLRKRAGRVSS